MHVNRPASPLHHVPRRDRRVYATRKKHGNLAATSNGQPSRTFYFFRVEQRAVFEYVNEQRDFRFLQVHNVAGFLQLFAHRFVNLRRTQEVLCRARGFYLESFFLAQQSCRLFVHLSHVPFARTREIKMRYAEDLAKLGSDTRFVRIVREIHEHPVVQRFNGERFALQRLPRVIAQLPHEIRPVVAFQRYLRIMYAYAVHNQHLKGTLLTLHWASASICQHMIGF